MTRFAVSRLATAVAFAAMLSPAAHARAQTEMPVLVLHGATDSTLGVSPGEALQNLQDVGYEVAAHRLLSQAGFPKDSVNAVARVLARKWLARMDHASEKGIETEPTVHVLTMAGEDSAAQRMIAHRLADTHLSVSDRAYTLYSAVTAFADPESPARLKIAEHYLAELNAIGKPLAARRFQGELALVDAYDEAGRSADAARHGVAAIHLVPFMGMHDCANLEVAKLSPYPKIARVVSGQPHGRATIDEMNAILKAATVPAADSVELDSSFYYNGKGLAGASADLIQAVARFGTTPGSIYSNRWLNTPDSTPATLAVNDGRVRVVMTTGQGCPGCVMMAMHLQSIADVDSTVRPIMVTWTDASWANRVVTSDSSASIYTNFWLNVKKIRYPIALWIAKQRDTLADGSVVNSLKDDSALARYPESGQPQFYVLDGEGRIRASFFEGTPVVEHEIVETVHRLVQEQSQAAHPAPETTQ